MVRWSCCFFLDSFWHGIKKNITLPNEVKCVQEVLCYFHTLPFLCTSTRLVIKKWQFLQFFSSVQCMDILHFSGHFSRSVFIHSIFSSTCRQYQVGKHVRIMLKKLEMTGHFLGQHKHITLLEADGWLMGLDPRKKFSKS